MAEVLFPNKKLRKEKLEPYGFRKSGNGYIFEADILENQFRILIEIDEKEKIYTKLMDKNFPEEEYVLHLVKDSEGEFVTGVRNVYQAVLDDIAEVCYETDIFQSETSRAVIQFVREKYGDELEYLWKKSNNAVWRRKDNRKWYAAVLTVPKSKIGLKGEEILEIIDLRIRPEELESTLDHVHYFPGYHMNKKSWYTIPLDGTVSVREICQRLEESYKLALK